MELKISISITVIISAILLFNSFGDDEIITFLDRTVFECPDKPASDFDHDFHYNDLELECNECHHVYENGALVQDKNSEDKRCSECHLLEATEEQKIPLMEAFHLKCKGCHEDKKEGPIMCGDCHKR